MEIESQNEIEDDLHECIIIRDVKLYFDVPRMPILFCTSQLIKNNLTAEEYKFIVKSLLPIGRIFNILNGLDSIIKTDISVNDIKNQSYASRLNVAWSYLIEKKYEYWIEGRHIGRISEYFNEESLNRI